MLLALTLVASACGGDDLSAASDESGGAGDGDPDGGGNASGTENALCPLDDIASPPPDFPFVKPPSLIALAYDGPDQLGPGVYELRGVTFEPEEVISELMALVFPDADFTQISDVPGQEAFDFIDPAGVRGLRLGHGHLHEHRHHVAGGRRCCRGRCRGGDSVAETEPSIGQLLRRALAMARRASRSASRRAISWRRSARLRPRATASSSLARPFTK